MLTHTHTGGEMASTYNFFLSCLFSIAIESCLHSCVSVYVGHIVADLYSNTPCSFVPTGTQERVVHYANGFMFGSLVRISHTNLHGIMQIESAVYVVSYLAM